MTVTLSIRQTWVWVLTPHLTYCMVLGKLPDLAEPQLSHFSNKAYFQDLDKTGDMVGVSAWHRAGAQQMFTGTHPSREREASIR